MANLYILAGVAGVGKTTWAREHNTDFNAKVISRDNIRFAYMKNDPDFLPSMDYFKYEKISGASPCCAYAGSKTYSCDKCCFESARYCKRRVFTDIRNRIRKLRGEG